MKDNRWHCAFLLVTGVLMMIESHFTKETALFSALYVVGISCIVASQVTRR